MDNDKKLREKTNDSLNKKRIGKKKIIGVTFFVVLLTAILIFAMLFQSAGKGDEAPDFTIEDLDGNTISLKEYRGKVVIIDLMATWCVPCQLEMEHLAEISDKYKNSDVVIMTIDVDKSETAEQLREFKEEFHGTWIFAMDSDGIDVKYGVKGYPTLVIIDKNGGIAYKNVGLVGTETLSEVIDGLL